MGETTAIEWTHHTFNPWIGCTKVHAGCTNCYAEKLAGRYGWASWGRGAPRKVKAESGWKEPLRWARDAAKDGERRRVFCASLADVLDEEAPPDAQARLWNLIRQTARLCSAPTGFCPDGHDGADGECPHCGRPAGGLDWLLLTKRPERWEEIPEDVRPLVWLGTSISDQRTADVWVPRLRAAQGFRLRFLSIEPLIGPIDLDQDDGGLHWLDPGPGQIDWIILGGESGPGARPSNIAWHRFLLRQCARAGVAVYEKQLGANVIDTDDEDRLTPVIHLHDRKGGDPSEWPEDLRVRQFPVERARAA